jgi:ATP-dependent Clp protease adaptor protein ClpS
MANIATKPRTKVRLKTERPRLHKVILVNDDFTPREFVVAILKAEFRMNEDQAYKVMITAHRRGVCVVAVFTRDVAETKATPAAARAIRSCSQPSRKNSRARSAPTRSGAAHVHCSRCMIARPITQSLSVSERKPSSSVKCVMRWR